MKAALLSAIPAGHEPMATLRGAVDRELGAAGYGDVRAFDLASTTLAFCQGDFDCWVKTPGQCRSKDAEADIVAAVHDADALVYLGPVTFGGHGYLLKRAVDRLLPLLSPFFTQRSSLTHHDPRYVRSPRVFSLGWAPAPCPGEAETFAALNDANAVNFRSPGCGAAVFHDGDSATWGATLAGLLRDPRTPGATIAGRPALHQALMTAATADAAGAVEVRRAALLVGSAKVKGTSVSEAIARSLAKRLERAGVATELHFATELVHEDARALRSVASMAGCDLFVLVTPLYVDSFPALATRALELLARARAEPRAPARFAAVINCGFPEAEQNRTALRIARHFAEAAGYGWCGGLPLGGGGVVEPGSALDQPHGPVAHVVRALDLAGPALAAGRALPREAIEAMAAAPLPDVLYRLIGDLGWRWEAYKNGVPQRDLRARPLDPPRAP